MGDTLAGRGQRHSHGTRTATRSTSADHVLYENDSDVFYASFLIDPADSQLANGRMTFELELSRLDGGGVPNFSFGVIDDAYSVGKGGNDVDAGGGTVTAAQQLVLGRIVYGDGLDDNEIVTLRVDPADESSTPVINGASVDFLNSGGGEVTSISMRGENMLGHPAFLRRALDHWLDAQSIWPQIMGEFSDSSLLKAFGQAGVGVFVAPPAIETEICRQYGVRSIGELPEIRERYYAISVERKLNHPAVVANSKTASGELFT